MMEYKDFKIPGKEYFPRPLWFWNAYPSRELLADIMDNAEKKAAYGGFGILAYDACKTAYMGEEYLSAYEYVIEKAREKGLKMCLYDEWWFPSGGAGGLLKERFPEACAKRLDKAEFDADGRTEITLPEGKLMAAVAMDPKTNEIVNLRGCINNGKLVWDAYGCGWKIMIFTCVMSDWDHVNYLDPAAVDKFIEVTHEAYYARFGDAFGDVIDSSFYDEPQMYTVGGRMWVDDFNEKFVERFGIEPDTLYPALWYDIGENTASARCMFHELRNDLYANGFPKVLQEWCTAHGISLTGHVDQEEVINPTGITGDLMKSFKYQDIPGYDEIFKPRRAHDIYKIVSSAANNWDKPLVMTECYGAMPEDLSIETMYDEAMEQYAKGMNLFVPHAVWLDPEEKIIFQPELSWRNPRYANDLKTFNEYCARMSFLLQEGRHAADIAVLYPVSGLNSAYYFDWGEPYLGGPAPEQYNYQQIGSWLSENIRKDFTFLHPEVLNERCHVEDNLLCLDNRVNFERYKVLIIPGTDAIDIDALKKIKNFWENGGVVIAAGKLPVHGTMIGMEAEVKNLLEDMFKPLDEGQYYSVKKNAAGGSAWHLPQPDAVKLDQILNAADVEFDVNITVEKQSEGIISYIHKVRDEKDIYYVVNCTAEAAGLNVSLNRAKEFELWDPHTGEVMSAEQTVENGYCNLVLELAAHHSVVIIEK